MSISQVVPSLVGNTKVKSIRFPMGEISSIEYFCKLLCDATSIRGIYNSIHTLEKIKGTPVVDTKDLEFNKYLELNRNEDKVQVVRNKILQYYFIGDFDVSPLINLPMSVLPEVICQIRSDTKQSAIFRLLKCIPELCNVAGRSLASDQFGKMNGKRLTEISLWDDGRRTSAGIILSL